MTRSIRFLSLLLLLSVAACRPELTIHAPNMVIKVNAEPSQLAELRDEDSTYTDTVYPIVLVHGLYGFKDIFGMDYFWLVPQALEFGGADVYMSDFGEMEIVPHYLQVGASDVFGFNPDYGTVVYLDGFQSTPLAKTGDSDKEQVLVDCLLRLDAENCHFKIANLTP